DLAWCVRWQDSNRGHDGEGGVHTNGRDHLERVSSLGKETKELDRGDRVDFSKLQAVAWQQLLPRLTLDQLDDLATALGQEVLSVDRGKVVQVEITDQEPPPILDQHGRENQ